MSSSTNSILCPAKVNLFLAVTGRRRDGFHELVSLVGKLDLADELSMETGPAEQEDSLCSDADWLDCGPGNLILKAAQSFREHRPLPFSAHFRLAKRVPAGAGLGGGSSDAAGALKLLNNAAENPLPPEELEAVAAEVGSDCPLFLRSGFVEMRGRGESLRAAPEAAARFAGKRVLLLKPPFPVSTPWAYKKLSQTPESFLEAHEAERRLRELTSAGEARYSFYNSLETVVASKYLAVSVLLAQIKRRFGFPCLMSGSGSACFALPPHDIDLGPAKRMAVELLGDQLFCTETRLSNS